MIWRAQVGVDSVEAASSSQSTLSRDVNVNRALLLRKLDMIVSSVENLADGNAPSSKNADIFPRIGVSDVCRTDARNTLRKWMSGPALNKGLPCSNLLALSRKAWGCACHPPQDSVGHLPVLRNRPVRPAIQLTSR